jgi:hypothetical protein
MSEVGGAFAPDTLAVRLLDRSQIAIHIAVFLVPSELGIHRPPDEKD